MSRSIIFLIFAAFNAMIFSSCDESVAERYKAVEERELESGVRYDSLFKGLYFGMEHQQFRDYCYYKNTVAHDFKNDGPHSSWVISKIPTGMKYPAAINFYPEFSKGRIVEMNAAIFYDYQNKQVAPFSRESLLKDVLQMITHWYGEDFFRIESPTSYQEEIYVSVKGNRRVIVYPTLTSEIRVKIQDLTALKDKPGYE